MAVFKFRNKWRAVVYLNGKPVASKSGFEKKTGPGGAQAWHDERLQSYRGGESVAVDAPATFAELLEKFEKRHLTNCRPGTATRYKVDIDQRIAPFFRYLILDRLAPGLLEDFKSKCIKDGLKPKSVNNCLHTLRLILNKGVKWGMIKESPYSLDSLQIPRKAYEWWDKREHVKAFLAAASKTRYYAVYLLAIETGMRYGEIVGLSKDDIDFGAGTIHVHRQWLERQGCYGPTKGNEERWVPFDPESELAKILWKTVKDSRHKEAVFTTATGNRPGKSGLAEKYFKAVQRKAGVPVICFHALRHTYASWFMRTFDNVWELKALLGHTDIKTTMRYVHHSVRDRKASLNLSKTVTHISYTSAV